MEGISLMMPNSPSIKSITINGKKIINEIVDGEQWLFNMNAIDAIQIRTLIEGYHNVNRYVDNYRMIQKYINQ